MGVVAAALLCKHINLCGSASYAHMLLLLLHMVLLVINSVEPALC
jgi:hypothetical protein